MADLNTRALLCKFYSTDGISQHKQLTQRIQGFELPRLVQMLLYCCKREQTDDECKKVRSALAVFREIARTQDGRKALIESGCCQALLLHIATFSDLACTLRVATSDPHKLSSSSCSSSSGSSSSSSSDGSAGTNSSGNSRLGACSGSSSSDVNTGEEDEKEGGDHGDVGVVDSAHRGRTRPPLPSIKRPRRAHASPAPAPARAAGGAAAAGHAAAAAAAARRRIGCCVKSLRLLAHTLLEPEHGPALGSLCLVGTASGGAASALCTTTPTHAHAPAPRPAPMPPSPAATPRPPPMSPPPVSPPPVSLTPATACVGCKVHASARQQLPLAPPLGPAAQAHLHSQQPKGLVQLCTAPATAAAAAAGVGPLAGGVVRQEECVACLGLLLELLNCLRERQSSSCGLQSVSVQEPGAGRLHAMGLVASGLADTGASSCDAALVDVASLVMRLDMELLAAASKPAAYTRQDPNLEAAAPAMLRPCSLAACGNMRLAAGSLAGDGCEWQQQLAQQGQQQQWKQPQTHASEQPGHGKPQEAGPCCICEGSDGAERLALGNDEAACVQELLPVHGAPEGAGTCALEQGLIDQGFVQELLQPLGLHAFLRGYWEKQPVLLTGRRLPCLDACRNEQQQQQRQWWKRQQDHYQQQQDDSHRYHHHHHHQQQQQQQQQQQLGPMSHGCTPCYAAPPAAHAVRTTPHPWHASGLWFHNLLCTTFALPLAAATATDARAQLVAWRRHSAQELAGMLTRTLVHGRDVRLVRTPRPAAQPSSGGGHGQGHALHTAGGEEAGCGTGQACALDGTGCVQTRGVAGTGGLGTGSVEGAGEGAACGPSVNLGDDGSGCSGAARGLAGNLGDSGNGCNSSGGGGGGSGGAEGTSAEELLLAGAPVIPSAVQQAFEAGYTVAVRALGSRDPWVQAVQEDLRLTFGLSPGSNLYLTPPGAQGLHSHFDDHCVFVLQLHGSKAWLLRPPEPHQRMPLAYHQAPVTVPTICIDQQGVQEVHLHAGDLLYIPRGWAHQACTSSHASPPTSPTRSADGGPAPRSANGGPAPIPVPLHEPAQPAKRAPTSPWQQRPGGARGPHGQQEEASAPPEAALPPSSWASMDGASMHLTFGLEAEGCMTWAGLLHFLVAEISDDLARTCRVGTAVHVRACQVLLHAWLSIRTSEADAVMLRRANPLLACPSAQIPLLLSTLQQLPAVCPPPAPTTPAPSPAPAPCVDPGAKSCHGAASGAVPSRLLLAVIAGLLGVSGLLMPCSSSSTGTHASNLAWQQQGQQGHRQQSHDKEGRSEQTCMQGWVPGSSSSDGKLVAGASSEPGLCHILESMLRRCLPACEHALAELDGWSTAPAQQQQQHHHHHHKLEHVHHEQHHSRQQQQQRQQHEAEGEALCAWLDVLCSQWLPPAAANSASTLDADKAGSCPAGDAGLRLQEVRHIFNLLAPRVACPSPAELPSVEGLQQQQQRQRQGCMAAVPAGMQPLVEAHLGHLLHALHAIGSVLQALHAAAGGGLAAQGPDTAWSEPNQAAGLAAVACARSPMLLLGASVAKCCAHVNELLESRRYINHALMVLHGA